MRKIIFLFVLAIFLIGIASAATICCEKTTGANPAWCQNVDSQSKCNSNYNSISAFCESTSFCKMGTCINQREGTCMPDTEKACTSTGGTWSDNSSDNLQQCQLGCCLIGDQAAFVTQTSCNRMSDRYGLKINWQSNIKDELTCLASANPQTKGACVYTDSKTGTRTCNLNTKAECQDMAKTLTDVNFHSGYLCTAPDLGTVCEKSTQTTCSGEDVYYTDTCGNLANIYDSSRYDDPDYWKTIQTPTCTVSSNPGNKDSTTCGACDYYSGSMCTERKVGDPQPVSGNHFCKNLDCTYTYKGVTKTYKHGESWCAYDNPDGTIFDNVPGSSDFRMICYNGEVTKEQCDPFRQKICNETTQNGVKISGCVVNLWLSCYAQNNSKDCQNQDVRHCMWFPASENDGFYFSSKGGLSNDSGGTHPSGLCLPEYSPGLLFWDDQGKYGNIVAANTICPAASAYCGVKYSDSVVFGKHHCYENCSCVDSNGAWQQSLNKICSAMGDCGVKVNYLGKNGGTVFADQFTTITNQSG
jgi:hypothetical protein